MLTFTTKAGTLAVLEHVVTKSIILPQLTFTAGELEEDPASVAERVRKRFAEPVIVRSSALSEDAESESRAGQYLSIAGVEPADILEAVRRVAAAFDDGHPGNQILVQPMLRDIAMSGVLFTVDPNTGGNYYVMNYDETGSSDAVTSGAGKCLETCYVFRGRKSGNERLNRLIDAAAELEELFGQRNIDIEFAFDRKNALYTLQARPLVLKTPAADLDMQSETLARAESLIRREMRPKPYVMGRRVIYGVMPDWNPAEMIGVRPRPLASSLYRRLITDGVWAYQRNNYGYRNLRSFPLMLDFCGLPYIDTRVSFNSFIPKGVGDALARKLADYYLDSLAAQPDKHDKVEFDIIFSCYTFDLEERVKVLGEHGFPQAERQALCAALRELTNNIINTADGLWLTDVKKIAQLEDRHKAVMESDLDPVSKIYWLLEDCARYGTLPFAGLARAGFIAVLLLKSLVSIGILSKEDYENYMGSLNTVGPQMTADRQRLSEKAFLKKYGHLRPGTYDITSLRYDDAASLYFGEQRAAAPVREHIPFSLTLEQYEAIQSEMQRQGLSGDVLALFKFLRAGIEGREHAKFVFTRSLSDALELLAELGGQCGLDREDMSYLDIGVIDGLYSSASDDLVSLLVRKIAEGKAKHNRALTFTMPPVILAPEDIYSFHMPTGSPNFITLKTVSGDVCTGCGDRNVMRDNILLIPAADPGYDWVFSCGIKGFITAYGGANSHMAIRAGELGIPAVIGAGEKLFELWNQAKTLHIDCANRRVEVLR